MLLIQTSSQMQLSQTARLAAYNVKDHGAGQTMIRQKIPE